MARGSITKRAGSRGTTWYAVVDIGQDPETGQRRQRRISGPTRKDVEARVTALLTDVDGGAVADGGRTTLRALSDRWLAASEASLKPATYRRYADIMRIHILPLLGAKPIARLTPLDIERLYADRRAAGLSPTTIHHIGGTLHRVLDQGERWGLIARNVCELAPSPRRATPEMRVWNPDQVAAVLRAAAGEPLEALWRLALLTGMRRGELLGLRWDDIDLEAGTLSVRRTLSRGKSGAWELGTPKTAASRRSIVLPALAVDGLRQHRIRQLERRLALGLLWQDSGFVFVNESGGPLHVNTLVRQFARLIATADVPRIRFHDLRHTSATLLLASGIHPKIVQERLGHSSIAMTLDRYSHVTKTMQREAADAFDRLLPSSGRAG